MSGDFRVFVEWEEHIVCHEKGNRVVHFYLKDASGNSQLAVVGTERSIRHMVYVVSEEFLLVCGSRISASAPCKWRARREVVGWLTSIVSSHPLQCSDLEMNGLQQAEDIFIRSTAGNPHQSYLPDKLVQRKLKFQNSDIEWSGIYWFCAKQLKHYSAFVRNGTTISVHSFVCIMAEEESHYLGYLEDMYEDKKGKKKVKVRWFHHSQEVKSAIHLVNPHPREVFITPHVQVISAECVNGPATVLTPKHYEKCVAAYSDNLSSVFHMCFRQFKNNKLKPFALTKLRGYGNQEVLSFFYDPKISKEKVKCHKLHAEDEKECNQDDLLRLGTKRRSFQGLENDFSIVQISVPEKQMGSFEPTYPKLKLKLLRKTMGIKVIGPKPPLNSYFKVGEKIELLSQDSGIRGCWFRCKILNTSQKKLKVLYYDVCDVDGLGKLEEWVPAFRVASPDKLGMRCPGRLTVRPCPPQDSINCTFEIGLPVDAWWSDGWWEGVVTKVDISGVGTLQVYVPGEDKLLILNKKDVRASRDYVGNKWVDISAKPDISECIPSRICSSFKLSASSAAKDGSSSGCSGSAILLSDEVLAISTIVDVQEDGRGLPVLDTSDDLQSGNVIDAVKQLHAHDGVGVNSRSDLLEDTKIDDIHIDKAHENEEDVVMEEKF